MYDHSIKNKTVFITGGAKNLGGLIATNFGKLGARAIVIHYHGEEADTLAEKKVSELRALGVQAHSIRSDLSSARNMENFFHNAVSMVGKPDIAINTVGMVLKKPMEDTNEDEFDKMCAVNTKSAFFLLRKQENI